ncbi:hypothetical protein C8R48DRAFT_217305 [Suillus tomentosus]|nr:hypothetical protein C8R48DRAFT_217305 [Suillus tomentosus]
MSTHKLLVTLHDTLKAIRISAKLNAETQEQSNACPCYPVVQLFLNLTESIHQWSSLSETQCHGSPSVLSSEWIQDGDSVLNMFNTTTNNVEAPFVFETGSPGFSGPSLMESDFIHMHQPHPHTALDPDNGIHAPYLSGPEYLFNPEPFPEFLDSFPPELSMTPSQTWSPHALPQSPTTSSSNGSLPYDYTCQWVNGHANDCHIEPSFNDIQPHAQNFGNGYPSSFGSGVDLHSPTPSWPAERKSDCTLLMDDMNDTSSFCSWDGGLCFSSLTVDKSEVAKHLQLHHGMKPGGDKEKIPCRWEGCGKEMKKESISRHIIAVHLDNKTECDSCGKKFARLDSKLRHLKNSNREGCRESESYDTRAKRRRLSLP